MGDQVWIVFLDGVAQKSVLPFADTEEKALGLWREHTGAHEIARSRLRGMPKTTERAATALPIVRDIASWFLEDEEINGGDFVDYVHGRLHRAGFIAEARAASGPQASLDSEADPALTVVRNIAHLFRDEHEEVTGADFIDYVYRELDREGFIAEAHAHAAAEAREEAGTTNHSRSPKSLTSEEQAALRAWADEEGPRWKAALRHAWETGNYRGSAHAAALQRIRNRFGPSWLVSYRLPLDPTEETKGYHCWVVTSRAPHQTRAWIAAPRAEAIKQVRAAVRNNRTEGGVQSRDPARPFEMTVALVNGKLVTTKFTA